MWQVENIDGIEAILIDKDGTLSLFIWYPPIESNWQYVKKEKGKPHA